MCKLEWLSSNLIDIKAGIKFSKSIRDKKINLVKTLMPQLRPSIDRLIRFTSDNLTFENYNGLLEHIKNYTSKHDLTYQQYIVFTLQCCLIMSDPQNPYRKYDIDNLVFKSCEQLNNRSILDELVNPKLLNYALPYPFITKNGLMGIETIVEAFLHNLIPLPITSNNCETHGKKSDPLAHILHDLYHGQSYFPNDSNNVIDIKNFKKMHNLFINLYSDICKQDNEKYNKLLISLFWMMHEQDIVYNSMQTVNDAFKYTFNKLNNRLSEIAQDVDEKQYYERELIRINNQLKIYMNNINLLQLINIIHIVNLNTGSKIIYSIDLTHRIQILRLNEIDYFFSLYSKQNLLFETVFLNYNAEALNLKNIGLLFKDLGFIRDRPLEEILIPAKYVVSCLIKLTCDTLKILDEYRLSLYKLKT